MERMEGRDQFWAELLKELQGIRPKSVGPGAPEFLQEQLRRFMAEHPPAEGWQLHRRDPGVGSSITEALPAFLRAKLPAGSWKEEIFTDISYASRLARRATRLRLTEAPYRRKKNWAHESDWHGDLAFEWKGSSFHFRRIMLAIPPELKMQAPFGVDMTLIAHKSMAAYEDLCAECSKWERVRSRRSRYVQVINGPDCLRKKTKWEELVLAGDLKRQIRESFEAFLEAKGKYRELGLPYRRGFLLVGPPGNGKTMLTRVLAHEYKVSVVTMLIKSDLEEGIVDRAFERAASMPPCVLLLEDLDKMLGATRVNLSYLLNKLDGLGTQEGILVVATTNCPERLDAALLHRPSRFDRVWEFKLPALEERRALLALRGARYFSEGALEEAARQTQDFSMAYVQEAVVSALMLAVQEKAEPRDEHLAESVRQLRLQVKTSSSPLKGMGEGRNIGFAAEG